MAELITMPKLGFDMAEGMLGEWLVKPGDDVAQGQTILLVETDKATVEVPAFRPGVLLQILVEAGASVPVGAPIGVIGEAGEEVDAAQLGLDRAGPPTPAAPASTAPAPGAAPEPAAAAADGAGERVIASPVAARMAGELGIDLRQVAGSGPGGRIVKRDIEAHLKVREQAPPAPPAPPPMAIPSYEPSLEDYATEPLSGMRQTIARRMAESKAQAPHFYITMEIDVAAAMSLRAQMNELLADAEKISVNDLITKASAIALREHPKVNASFAGDALHVHRQVNIGIAVAREAGLVTAVVRDCDRKSLAQIARETREVVARARDGRMKPEDMVGATFTISNLGMFDVDDFIAIINPPQAAILAVGAVRRTPVVDASGQIVVGARMKATLSADHRVTDGAEAARFMQTLKAALEQPMRLVL